MNETFYLYISEIDGDSLEYHLCMTYEEALNNFKNFVNDVIDSNGVYFTDNNGHSYNEIMKHEYFRDGIFSARIEELELE